MKVSYYPGCSLEGTAKSYHTSVLRACSTLGVELQEVPEWSCCGSSAALKTDAHLSTALSAHNLALVERQRNSEVVAPCPFCFRRLKSAQQEMQSDPTLKAAVQRTIETELHGNVKVFSLLEYIRHQVGLDAIANRVTRPLKGLKLIPYYGCYVVKPPTVTQFDDPENPTSLDEILRAAGAEVLDWDFKAECCGAGLSLSKTEKVCELSGRLIREAAARGADAMVVVCQLCQANLDIRQPEIGAQHHRDYRLPIMYFTQALGLAFGVSARDLGLQRHMVDPLPLLKAKGFAS